VEVKRDQLLILIAIWEFLTAMPLFIAIVAISVFAYPAVISNGGVGGIFGVSVAMLAVLPFFCLAVGAGVGLLLRQEWGRVLAIIHSALSLLFIPIGTIVGTLSIVFLVTSGTREIFKSSEE
jgi:hypothetical protein